MVVKRNAGGIRSRFQFSVDAVFGDGKRISLRDFDTQGKAVAWSQGQTGRDFYPGRVYRLEIREFEYLPEQE